MRGGDKRWSQRRKRVALQAQFVVVVAATTGHVICTQRALESATVAHAAAVPTVASKLAAGWTNLQGKKAMGGFTRCDARCFSR